MFVKGGRMKIEINFQTHIPIYIQVMDQIKGQLAAGVLNPGDQLPTVRQLAADLRVNFNTIARAYRLLDEAGIISTQHGRGTFILEPPNGDAVEEMRRQDLMRLADHFLAAANNLGYTPDEVKAILNKKFKAWKETGAPPAPEAETA
jgi:GntR family transcriptional regulator